MEIAVLAALSALVMKVIDFLRLGAASVRGEKGHGSALVTQIAAWVAGVGAMVLAAHAGMAQDLTIPGVGVTIGSLDGFSLVLAGMMLGSSGSVVVDVKQAIDATDSAVKPPLMKGGS